MQSINYHNLMISDFAAEKRRDGSGTEFRFLRKRYSEQPELKMIDEHLLSAKNIAFTFHLCFIYHTFATR
ncbi:MAG: hypothetical protein ABIO05_07925 [Ferruginibacter sp.]